MSSFRAVSSFRGVKFPPAVWPTIGDAERNLSLLRPYFENVLYFKRHYLEYGTEIQNCHIISISSQSDSFFMAELLGLKKQAL